MRLKAIIILMFTLMLPSCAGSGRVQSPIEVSVKSASLMCKTMECYLRKAGLPSRREVNVQTGEKILYWDMRVMLDRLVDIETEERTGAPFETYYVDCTLRSIFDQHGNWLRGQWIGICK